MDGLFKRAKAAVNSKLPRLVEKNGGKHVVLGQGERLDVDAIGVTFSLFNGEAAVLPISAKDGVCTLSGKPNPDETPLETLLRKVEKKFVGDLLTQMKMPEQDYQDCLAISSALNFAPQVINYLKGAILLALANGCFGVTYGHGVQQAMDGKYDPSKKLFVFVGFHIDLGRSLGNQLLQQWVGVYNALYQTYPKLWETREEKKPDGSTKLKHFPEIKGLRIESTDKFKKVLAAGLKHAAQESKCEVEDLDSMTKIFLGLGQDPEDLEEGEVPLEPLWMRRFAASTWQKALELVLKIPPKVKRVKSAP